MKKAEQKNNYIIAILACVIVSIVCLGLYTQTKQQCEKDINNLTIHYNFYTKGYTKYMDGIYNSNMGVFYYKLFSYSYDNLNLNSAITYCESARGFFRQSTYDFSDGTKLMEEALKYKQSELLSEYIKYAKTSSNISWSLYEACEYFEAASTYYINNETGLGIANVNKANEKIREHDNYVVPLNEISSKIKLLEE